MKFRLPEGGEGPSDWLDALFEAGCDDATIGIGKRGYIALDFTRGGGSSEHAVRSAIAAVTGAIPGAVLTEVGPDLVSLTDLAEMLECSRQNLRKYAMGEIRGVRAPFPAPVFTGNPSLWRLAEVAAWLDQHTELRLAPPVTEVARIASRLNLDLQNARLREAIAAA
ncbi:MAG: DNA-binding protein [Rhodospirillales bacterium]